MKSSAGEVLRFALVGCGRIAKRHSELLGHAQIKGAELAAACDIQESRASKIGSEFGVPTFTDFHEMMRTIKPDLAVVLTESGRHAQHVCELAQYGADIVVEKPMALTLEDADRMIAECDRNGIRLFVVKQNRFNVPVLKAKEAIERGRIGKAVLGTVRVRWCRPQSYYDQDSWRGTWAWDGGVLTNQASHHIDLLEWMMGDVQSVQAMSATALVDIEAEDTAVVILRFMNGALGVIEATTAVRPTDLEGSLSLLGEKGSIEIGGFAVNEMKVWQFTEAEHDDSSVMSAFSVNPPNVYGFGHKAYYDHVVESIKSKKKHLVDGLEGRKSLELINAIYEAIETRREVFLRFKPQYCRLGHK